MKKIRLVLLFLFGITAFSQTPAIVWQESLGGTSLDVCEFIQQTTDGGYILAGRTSSSDGNITGNHGSYDCWIVKLANTGAIQWKKCLGGTGDDSAYCIQQTTDGGYIVAGNTTSNDGDVTGNHGSNDYWIAKLTNTGTIDWQKCLGGTGADLAQSIQQTTDGGYIAAGYTKSTDGDVSGIHGTNFDYWIVKLTNIGTIQWQKCLGGTVTDTASSIQQTTDGGYIVAGSTKSIDGDVTGNHGSDDYWIVKLTNIGTIQWQKCLGGTLSDAASSIKQTTDGGYIVAGFAISNNGDVTGTHGSGDYWIVKLTNTGTIQWQKCLGGSGSDLAQSIQQTTDGGYVVSGYTKSNDGNVTGYRGGKDSWIVKLTNTGAIQWQKCLGGTGDDSAHCIKQTTDGGYIIGGLNRSNDGDVTFHYGSVASDDFWIVKLAADILPTNSFEQEIAALYPNPVKDAFSVSSNEPISEVAVYDLLGKCVFTAQNPESEINISALPKGIYVAKLKTETGVSSVKLIKE